MNNLQFNDSSLTVNTDEFIDLDTALLEEELRSLNATPEYNKISLKSIDAQEAERIRRSLVTPVFNNTPCEVATPRSRHAPLPDFRSFSKSPTDSYDAESIALFRNLNDQDTNILDFASSNLDDIIKSIELEDDVTIIHQIDKRNNYKPRVPQHKNINTQPTFAANVAASREQSAKKPTSNRYSIDIDGLAKLRRQQQESSRHRPSSSVLKPIETSTAAINALPAAAQRTLKKIPSRADTQIVSQQADRRRWSSFLPEQRNDRQQETPLESRRAPSILTGQASAVRTIRRTNAINNTSTTTTYNAVSATPKKPLYTGVRRMSSQSLEKHREASIQQEHIMNEKIDQHNQRLACLNRSDNPTVTLRKRASIHGYNLLNQQNQQSQGSKNPTVSKNIYPSGNDQKLQRRHTVRIASTNKERSSSSQTSANSTNIQAAISKKRLSLQELSLEPSVLHQNQVFSLQITKKESAPPTVPQQYQRRQRAFSVPESHCSLQPNAEDQPITSSYHGRLAVGSTSATTRHQKGFQQLATTLKSPKYDVPQADRLLVPEKNRVQQSSDLHVLPSESSSGLSNSSASSSSYSSSKGPAGTFRDPPTPPTHAALITASSTYAKRNSMPMMNSRLNSEQQPFTSNNKVDYHHYSHHLSRIAEVSTAPSSEHYTDGYDDEQHNILNVSNPPAFPDASQQQSSNCVHYLKQEEEEVYNNYDTASPIYRYHTFPRRQAIIPVASTDVDRHVHNTVPRRQRVISEDDHTYNRSIAQTKRYDSLLTKYHSTTTTQNVASNTLNGQRTSRNSSMLEKVLPSAVAPKYSEEKSNHYVNEANQNNVYARHLSRRISAEHVTESAKKVLASVQERRKNGLLHTHSNYQQQQQRHSFYYTR